MSERQMFILAPAPHPARQNCAKAVLAAPEGWVVTIQPPKRSLEANARMWAVLAQLCPIDWYGQQLTAEEWKQVITASLKRQKVVPGVDGGFVVCGSSTSQMSQKAISEVIEAAYAFGATHGIKFKEVQEDLRRVS